MEASVHSSDTRNDSGCVVVKLVKPSQTILRLRVNAPTLVTVRRAIDAVLGDDEADKLTIWFVDRAGVLRELSDAAVVEFEALLKAPVKVVRSLALAKDTASQLENSQVDRAPQHVVNEDA